MCPATCSPARSDLAEVLREQLDYLIDINHGAASKADEARFFRVMALLLEPFEEHVPAARQRPRMSPVPRATPRPAG
jgi:hypothetical protein